MCTDLFNQRLNYNLVYFLFFSIVFKSLIQDVPFYFFQINIWINTEDIDERYR